MSHPAHDGAPRGALERVCFAVAAALGKPGFIVAQTALIVLWVTYNVAVAAGGLAFDPYPFILLNLAFSTQAAYAAPAILFVQNREAAKDRARADIDYETNRLALLILQELREHLIGEAGRQVP